MDLDTRQQKELMAASEASGSEDGTPVTPVKETWNTGTAHHGRKRWWLMVLSLYPCFPYQHGVEMPQAQTGVFSPTLTGRPSKVLLGACTVTLGNDAASPSSTVLPSSPLQLHDTCGVK